MRERDEIRAEGHAEGDLDWADEGESDRKGLLAAGGSPAELEGRIDSIRREMDATLREFEKRVSPGHMVEVVRRTVKDVPAGYLRNLGGAVRANPVSVALICIGLGWLMLKSRRSLSERRRALPTGWRLRPVTLQEDLAPEAGAKGRTRQMPTGDDLH